MVMLWTKMMKRLVQANVNYPSKERPMLGIFGSTRPIPWLAAAVVILVIAFAVQVANAPSASASADGCTWVDNRPFQQVCIEVVGDGVYVQTARAWFDAPFNYLCNTQLYITFFDVDNQQYDQPISPPLLSCEPYAYYEQTYNLYMLPGRVCGAVSISGVLEPGACVSITY
jgi:hypothetical protein